jgi:hypothetical protein
LTLGGNFTADVRNRQRSYVFSQPTVWSATPPARDDRLCRICSAGVEYQPKVTAYLGIRFDDSKAAVLFPFTEGCTGLQTGQPDFVQADVRARFPQSLYL